MIIGQNYFIYKSYFQTDKKLFSGIYEYTIVGEERTILDILKEKIYSFLKFLIMRLEYKYIVPTEKIECLRQQLLPFVEYDPFSNVNGTRDSTVKSVYFDSKKLKDYHDKREGVYKRKKNRIRRYNRTSHNSKMFLEIKKKIGSYIYKNRTRILFSELQNFLESKNSDLIETDII